MICIYIYIRICSIYIYIYKYLNHDNRDFWQVQLAGVPVFPDSTRDSAKMKAAQKRGVIDDGYVAPSGSGCTNWGRNEILYVLVHKCTYALHVQINIYIHYVCIQYIYIVYIYIVAHMCGRPFSMILVSIPITVLPLKGNHCAGKEPHECGLV